MTWKDYFIFTSSDETSVGTSRSMSFYLGFAFLAGILSIFRQLGRMILRNDYNNSSITSQIDGIELMITGLLTFTFYALVLRFMLQFAERKDTPSDGNEIMFKLGLVAQLAVLRDALYLIWFVFYYINTSDDTYVSEMVFWHLDVLVWFFTIVFVYPQFINRLRNSIAESDGQIMVAFIISLVAFFISYLFNYVILRLIIALPLGRNF